MMNRTASKASSTLGPVPAPNDDTNEEETPALHSLGPAAHPGIRPVLNRESSAASPRTLINSAYHLFPVGIAAVVFKTLLFY